MLPSRRRWRTAWLITRKCHLKLSSRGCLCLGNGFCDRVMASAASCFPAGGSRCLRPPREPFAGLPRPVRDRPTPHQPSSHPNHRALLDEQACIFNPRSRRCGDYDCYTTGRRGDGVARAAVWPQPNDDASVGEDGAGERKGSTERGYGRERHEDRDLRPLRRAAGAWRK